MENQQMLIEKINEVLTNDFLPDPLRALQKTCQKIQEEKVEKLILPTYILEKICSELIGEWDDQAIPKEYHEKIKQHLTIPLTKLKDAINKKETKEKIYVKLEELINIYNEL